MAWVGFNLAAIWGRLQKHNQKGRSPSRNRSKPGEPQPLNPLLGIVAEAPALTLAPVARPAATMPIMKLNSLEPFNGDINLPPSYTAPSDKFHPKGKVCVLDRSGSMGSQEDEFKLTLSMIKALSGLDTIPPVPKPTGNTNLIGKIKKIVESPDFGEQEIIIVTDGLDNQHDINDFHVGVTESGEPRMINIKQENYPNNYDGYMRARQEAILDYLAYIGAQVHIIGIGNEVKELLKMASSRPMTVAHVPRRATASQVATVVGAAINIVRDTSVAAADFSTAEEHSAVLSPVLSHPRDVCR